MLRVALISVLLVACKGGSESSRDESAPAKRKEPAPEPPGGPPSCAEVGAHLAAALEVPNEVRGNANGVDVKMSGKAMHGAMRNGLIQACRDVAWSQETRACVMTWNGNILRERASLTQACPGTVKN